MTDLTFIQQIQPYFTGKEKEMPTREWAVVGPEGAVLVWARWSWSGNYFYGGVEYHHRKSDEDGWLCHTADCHLLHGDCYSDGSGLQFDEQIRPFLQPGLEPNEQFMRGFLTQRYKERFLD